MPAEAGVILEGDGKRLFTGRFVGAGSAGTNEGAAGGSTDLRWNGDTGAIEQKVGAAWVPKVAYVLWDA